MGGKSGTILILKVLALALSFCLIRPLSIYFPQARFRQTEEIRMPTRLWKVIMVVTKTAISLRPALVARSEVTRVEPSPPQMVPMEARAYSRPKITVPRVKPMAITAAIAPRLTTTVFHSAISSLNFRLEPMLTKVSTMP